MDRGAPSDPQSTSDETAVLGDLLVRHRDTLGTSVEELSAKSGMSAEQIEQVESGRHELTEAEMADLLASYEIAPPDPRFEHYAVEVSIDGGWISLHGLSLAVESPVADLNLQRYLCLVHTNQSLELGSQIPLRSVDLNLLRFALAVRRDAVLANLAESQGATTAVEAIDQARTRKPARIGIMLVAGVAAVTVGLSATQSLQPGAAPATRVEVGTPMILERTVAEATATNAGVEVAPQVDIGTALVVERDPGS